MKRLRFLLALAMSGIAPPPALAHAFLDHAVPGVGSTVVLAPRQLQLFFTQPLEAHFSGAALTDSAGRPVATGAATIDPRNPAEMVLTVPALPPGKYKVTWHAVSADTHRTEGDFTFEIKR